VHVDVLFVETEVGEQKAVTEVMVDVGGFGVVDDGPPPQAIVMPRNTNRMERSVTTVNFFMTVPFPLSEGF